MLSIKLKMLFLFLSTMCLFLFDATLAVADITAGIGYSGVTYGRRIPGLSLSLDLEKAKYSAFSIGVKTPVYFHNVYQFGAYLTWPAGNFLYGDVDAGIGGSVQHAIRGYREDRNKDWDRESNTVLGPSMYVDWEMFTSIFFSIEVLLGIRNKKVFSQYFQETVIGSIGVRF